MDASIQKALLQVQPHQNKRFNDFTNKTQDIFEAGSQQYLNKLEAHLGEQYRKVTERSLSVCDQLSSQFSASNLEQMVEENVEKQLKVLEKNVTNEMNRKLSNFSEQVLKQQTTLQKLIKDQQEQLDLVLRNCTLASENSKLAAKYAETAKNEAMSAKSEATYAKIEAQNARVEANYARSEVARSEINVKLRSGTSMSSLISVEDQERMLKTEVKQLVNAKKYNQAFTKILCESVNSEMNSSSLLTWIMNLVKVDDLFSRGSSKGKNIEKLEQDVMRQW